MGTLRAVALFVLTLSFLTFVALFGRLPALRNTPIGFVHRLIWIHIPNFAQRIDIILTGGRGSRAGARFSHYLLYQKHPLVLIFFLGLLTGSSALLLPVIWPRLSASLRFPVVLLLPLPYIFTYLCVYPPTPFSPHITPTTLSSHLTHYPYDYTLYHDFRPPCRTCLKPKPPRSKHCNLCGTCVARADHHCVWVNNCLGRGNYKFFLLLLLTSSVTIAYGAYIAWAALAPDVTRICVAMASRRSRLRDGRNMFESFIPAFALQRFRAAALGLSIAVDVGGLRVTGVGLLAVLTAPLPLGLLVYHVRLIHAGTTTNESSKWADLGEDMREGIVFVARVRKELRWGSVEDEDDERGRWKGEWVRTEGEEGTGRDEITDVEDSSEEGSSDDGASANNQVSHRRLLKRQKAAWPLGPRQVAIRCVSGLLPDELPPELADLVEPGTWQRCWKLVDVDNIYDLGFWDNLSEFLLH
ncbi:DHHC palmitoyltransferase-domain-containing protein [Lineolata rhizophorae]|uniref:Palmitoyltransferase n=1 Tax=Lineolata rhizophorae TaxID=578093 RepID=A0A6A6NPR2_9PEZI|nr:DHHC palmitoyltransferase-domain-containing protein [Lineolata rhizophorae]